jgi:hypothetical protein
LCHPINRQPTPPHERGFGCGGAATRRSGATANSRNPVPRPNDRDQRYGQAENALMVNTASYCGLTKQYAELKALCAKYREHALVALGLPSNCFCQT